MSCEAGLGAAVLGQGPHALTVLGAPWFLDFCGLRSCLDGCQSGYMIGAQPPCPIPVDVPSLPLGLVSKGTVLFGSGPGVICLVLVCGSGWGPANMVPRPSTQRCWAGQGQMGPELHFCEEPSLVSLHPWATWQEREESVCSHVMERVRRQCWCWDGWLPLENS